MRFRIGYFACYFEPPVKELEKKEEEEEIYIYTKYKIHNTSIILI